MRTLYITLFFCLTVCGLYNSHCKASRLQETLLIDAIHLQDSSIVKDTIVNKKRLWAITGLGVSSLAGTYVFLKNAWWSEQSLGFHFDQGRDLKYALNTDKVSHFLGGMATADGFKDLLLWANVPEKKSHLYGAFFGVFVQGAIEIKDGYAPRWGFSTWDLISGSLGSFYPMAQRYIKPFNTVDWKMSYYKWTNRYYEFNPHAHITGDYINQTYWASFKINDYLKGKAESIWPDWLAISAGVSIDETTDGQGGGNLEYFLAIDYDFDEILNRWKSPFWRKFRHYLNYIKFPGPAIRFTPSIQYFGLYM